MLKILRSRKVKKNILYVLAAVIIPAFVLWGSASLIRDRKDMKFAGKIFGKNITYKEYIFTLNNWRNKLKMQFGDKAYYIEKMLDANQAVWDSLILTHEAIRRRIKISDKELVDHIASLPPLQKDGVFSHELYDLLLKYSLNTTPRVFEEQTKQSLMLKALFDEITKDIKVSDEEILQKYREKNEQVKVSYVGVVAQVLEKDISISDEQIKEYYQDKSEEFKIPLQINLQFTGFDYPKDATDEQKEDIDNKLKNIKETLRENIDIDKLNVSAKYELNSQETGFFALGEPIPHFGWLQESTDILFGLEKDQYSEIIKTARGPYIFQLKEKRKDYMPTLEESKKDIKNKLLKEKSTESARKKISEIEDKIKSKQSENQDLSLKEICEAQKIEIKETKLFTRDSYVPGIGMTEDFNDVAFGLKNNQISEIVELPHGFFILGDAVFEDIDMEKFEAEKKELKEATLAEKKAEKFEKFSEKLKKEAKLVDNIGSLQQQN